MSKYLEIITFYAQISDIVPNHKLPEVAEFINRLNEQLLVGSLYLNYENRAIENRLTYYVGNSPLNEEKFDFYYGLLIGINLNRSFTRIIKENENPAIVALDWSS